MNLVTLECAHVEQYACEDCATPRTPKIKRSQLKNFTHLMSNVSNIIFKESADNESMNHWANAVRQSVGLPAMPL